jgi:1,4-dihydroxy-2-naphthoate octaprenyltransferase
MFLKQINLICDLDGKILSFNRECQIFFGLDKKEVLGKKRIFNFIDAKFVIEFIKNFSSLKIENILFLKVQSKIKVHSEQSYFSNFFMKKRFDDRFITVKIQSSNYIPKRGLLYFFDFFNFVFRIKFTLGSVVPLFFSFFWSINKFDEYTNYSFIFLVFGLLFFHISANTFNDYFDWKSGRDKINVDYVLSSTGGSRSIDFNILTDKQMFFVSILSFVIVLFCGIILFFLRGVDILFFGLFGAFCVYFYSAPPIHLASRYGMGELMHIICLGPLLVSGCCVSLTGNFDISNFFVGVPFGLLITCCLLLNEIPDANFDRISNKNNLVVFLGIKNISYLFYLLVFLSFSFLFFCIIFFDFSRIYFFSFWVLFYLIKNCKFLFNLSDRFFLYKSCIIGFNVYLYFSLSLIFLSFLNVILFFYPW